MNNVPRTLPNLTDLSKKMKRAAREELAHLISNPQLLMSHPALWSVSSRKCQAEIEAHSAENCIAEEVLRELAKVDVAALAQLGGRFANAANAIRTRQNEHYNRLRRKWQVEGWIECLESMGAESVIEILRQHVFRLPGSLNRPTLLIPHPESPHWLLQISEWIQRHPVGTGERLLVLAHPADGLKPGEIWLRLAVALSRHRIVDASHVSMLLIPDSPLAEISLLASMGAWIPAKAPIDRRIRFIADAFGVTVEDITPKNPRFNLPEGRPVRCLAWPNWESEGEIRDLLNCAAPLVGSERAGLVLRHQAPLDGDLGTSVGRLSRAFEALFGSSAELDVYIEERPMQEGDWSGLVRSVDVAIELPSSRLPGSLLEAMGCPVVRTPDALRERMRLLDEAIRALPVVCLA